MNVIYTFFFAFPWNNVIYTRAHTQKKSLFRTYWSHCRRLQEKKPGWRLPQGWPWPCSCRVRCQWGEVHWSDTPWMKGCTRLGFDMSPVRTEKGSHLCITHNSLVGHWQKILILNTRYSYSNSYYIIFIFLFCCCFCCCWCCCCSVCFSVHEHFCRKLACQ